ncbi:hypothetical protein KSF_108580 [Reticulibacter mediterranei]|uniref:NACHT domain-containing protein n=1 Tax=Reticulibacter mediterranei TaxID=2778369 RepID=A0A8J3N9P3_9CHLR|nr:NACHT domain-containing protein [Reticulibacter mediterranei]GHP00811.1 hypothetical protein KSF_108580 [Reticulibacter mediterranei]
MADPRQQPKASGRSGWVRLCRLLWRGLCFVWVAILLNLGTNIVSTRLTSQTDFPASAPVGWLLEHLVLVLIVGACLLSLTVMCGLLGYREREQAPASSFPLSPRQRTMLIRGLQKEYERRFAQALPGIPLLSVALHEWTDLVQSSAQQVFQRMDLAHARPLPPGTTLIEVYDEAGHGLLILGAPGSGKTTLLLDLARTLLTRAGQDLEHPIPVLLNLSSWSRKQALASWLVEQMSLVYSIPTHIGQTLLYHGLWLPLLDGLDEVDASARTACIQAIVAFRKEHFLSLVVSSRSQEYVIQEERLSLPSAVVLQPLQPEQVLDVFEQLGDSMKTVRAALATNALLRNLLTTPLIVSVILQTYQDAPLSDLLQRDQKAIQQHIFERYIQRALRPLSHRYAEEQVRTWLIWLAQHMQQQHLTEFYLEWLQYSWLPTTWAQLLDRVCAGWLAGWSLGLRAGICLGLCSWLFLGPSIGMLWGGVSMLVVGCSAGGLVGWIPRPLDDCFTWKGIWRMGTSMRVLVVLAIIGSGLVAGGLFALFFGVVSGLGFGVLDMLAFALVLGLFDRFLRWLIQEFSTARRSVRRPILPHELLSWSRKGIFPGLLAGWGGVLLIWPLHGVYAGLFVGVLSALAVGLVGGLSSQQIKEEHRMAPNQGIRRSGGNALRVGLVIWLAFGFLFGTAFAFFFGLASGIGFGLLGGLCLALFFGFSFGGNDFLSHYLVRLLLWRSGALPLGAVRFLEEVTVHHLLQRVGGGYRFVHPLIQEHLASQGIQGQSPSSQQRSLNEG